VTSTSSITSQFSPWLTPIAYPLACRILLPAYFRQIEVIGRHNLPTSGPAILAPTHRSRWDALLMGYAAGRWVTGRDLRFMVSANEVSGVQGWFIRRLGGFPLNPDKPSIASLRHGLEILLNGEVLVVFPEGAIFRDYQVHHLKPGLARMALQAEAMQPGLGIKIVPISFHYDNPEVRWRSRVNILIGTPLEVSDCQGPSTKQNAKLLTTNLRSALEELDQIAMGNRTRDRADRELSNSEDDKFCETVPEASKAEFVAMRHSH
jgi:1-acyl-sn-glycerol-3-phosphate acyltransferase